MNVLIVSPYFSPYKGVGALRMSSLAKYMLEQGDVITVLRYDPNEYPDNMCDSTELENITYVNVNKATTFKDGNKKIFTAIEEIINNNTIDIIVCSCGPFYTMEAVVNIKTNYNIPYVLDYRDLWIYDDRKPKGTINKLRNILFKIRYYKYEKKAVEFANLFITVTETCLQTMKSNYKINNSSVIYNGYDDAQLDGIKANIFKKTNKFVITFFGKLSYYSKTDAECFFLAVKELIDEGHEIIIRHIGQKEQFLITLMHKINYPLSAFCNLGLLSYREGIEELLHTNACSLIVDHKLWLGTKTFDYIFVNKPIIFIAPNGSDIKKLFNNFEHAYACSSKKDIKRAIIKCMDKNIKLLDNDYDTASFSRSNQNKIYRNCIKTVLQNKRQHH